jgi:2,4-dienoyl-CoA reductase-like NADH-dependent reductase (Old Yellow Enzyme family)
MSLFSPLKLANGITIPNRIAKAAMEENMADDDHAPSDDLCISTRPGPRVKPA